MNDISKQIKKFRKKYNISQEELAEKLFVTRQAVSNWETKKTRPDLENIEAMSKIFGVDMMELLYGKEDSVLKTVSKFVLVVFAAILFMGIGYGIASENMNYLHRYESASRRTSSRVRAGFESLKELKRLDKLSEEDWGRICYFAERTCVILDIHDINSIYNFTKEDWDWDVDAVVTEFFNEVNEELQNADFNNLTEEQKEYFIWVGGIIDNAVYGREYSSTERKGNNVLILYDYLKAEEAEK